METIPYFLSNEACVVSYTPLCVFACTFFWLNLLCSSLPERPRSPFTPPALCLPPIPQRLRFLNQKTSGIWSSFWTIQYLSMALPYIWSKYKQLEQQAHRIVFTEQHKLKPTQSRELADEIDSFLQTCNKRKRKEVQSLIRQSLVLREKSGKIYSDRQRCAEERGDIETSCRLRRSICNHAYYFSLMNSLLPEQSQILSTCTQVSQQVKKQTIDTPVLTFACLDPNEDVGVSSEIRPGEIPASYTAENGIITSQVDFSLDEDDLDNFCITIESGLDEMLAILTKMNQGQITPDIAIIRKWGTVRNEIIFY